MQPFLGNMADQQGRLKFINGVQVNDRDKTISQYFLLAVKGE